MGRKIEQTVLLPGRIVIFCISIFILAWAGNTLGGLLFGLFGIAYGIFVPSEVSGRWEPFWISLKDEIHFYRKSYWKILNIIFLLPLSYIMIFHILPLGIELLWVISGKDAFVIVVKDFVYAYSVLLFFSALPFLLMLINAMEYMIPWAREDMGWEAKHGRGDSYAKAQSKLAGAFVKFMIPLLVIGIISLFQYYSFNSAGIHEVRFPFKTKNYTWENVLLLKMNAGESVTCSVLLNDGREIELKKGLMRGVKDDKEILNKFVLIREQLRLSGKAMIQTNIAPEAKELVESIIGKEAQ